jgi:hypothetical protein
MRVSILATLLIIGTSYMASAEAEIPESTRRAAIELIDLMDIEMQMMSGATAMADAMIQGNPMLAPYRDVLLTWAGNIMTWEAVRPKFVAIFVDVYSEKELHDIAEFYRTPTGKKSLSVMPELVRRQALVGSELAQEHLPELRRMIEARAAELETFSPAE